MTSIFPFSLGATSLFLSKMSFFLGRLYLGLQLPDNLALALAMMELAKGEAFQRKDNNDTERVRVTLNSQGRLQRSQVRQKGSLSAVLPSLTEENRMKDRWNDEFM